MQRKDFIKASLMASTLNITDLLETFGKNQTDELMPVLFVGHGSPMNAIEQNEFTENWQKIGSKLQKPKAILCISAHWQTNGTFVTAMEKPKTIHDFYGFPPALNQTEYPAFGSNQMAKNVISLVEPNLIKEDNEWGLDHGCWSVLKQMYPLADIPVLQLSLDYTLTPTKHAQLAKQLMALRKQGVLILGSGNIVHNLGKVNWQGGAFDWALSFDKKVEDYINNRNFDALNHYENMGTEALLSIPTNEHYLPLLYTLALANNNDKINYFNSKVIMGSISMRSLLIG